MRKTRLIFGIFALSLASTSCLRQKTQARVFTPPPARAHPQPAEDGSLTLPEAPQIAADQASVIPPPLPENPGLTAEIPEAPKREARRTAAPVAPAPKPATTGPVAPAAVAPRLAQMLTPEEQRENVKALDESLDRVNKYLLILEGKNLTADQKETAERIRTFRKQAEQAREQDLLTAVSLARRADLLAKDLLERLP
jgi:hypothetical protein